MVLIFFTVLKAVFILFSFFKIYLFIRDEVCCVELSEFTDLLTLIEIALYQRCTKLEKENTRCMEVCIKSNSHIGQYIFMCTFVSLDLRKNC